MNEVSTINQGTALAAPGGYDPYAAYGAEAAQGGNFLKFSKGEWLLGQNDDEIALGRRLAANMDELSIGWIRWADSKPVERRLGLLAQGYKPETRDQLGYDDQDAWELDKEGRPKDPWNFTNELPLADPDDGEQMTFSASSKGGIGCIGNLCKAFARAPERAQGLIPVLELGRDSYKHAEYGKTYVPVLTIADWVENGSVPIPAADGGDEDEPAPAAKASAGSKTRF
ncbi:hypothetical protein FPZ24_08235 [Sphingomonas panacisoli]|uniref:Uncharacterized protein n=1 Tax=Sphingomonas panacisoli TaxID=1813879 RepID=A0A5B8LHF8_9SPHN|nr:hypothetical protein [Sphingomonas panacisoli]QDZ07471.1 hypothetical protein FPZ24_08235 [Sphingomonas panacisoli]